jgi:flagellar basal-body rod protein FlgB
MNSVRLFDNTISLLERVLDFASLRHNVIASNIANLDTPGYRARELLFKQELKQALSAMEGPGFTATSPNADAIKASEVLEKVSPRLVFEKTLNMTDGANTVDIDQEMKKLAENNLFYDLAVQLMARKLSIIKESIG